MISEIKDFFQRNRAYIYSILIALGVGVLSALLTRKNMNLFDSIKKPMFVPPSMVFMVVWTILFILMGISAARIYMYIDTNERQVREALTTYGISLAFNFMWSIIFFNMQTFLFAFFWLISLWILIIITIIEYRRIDKLAAWLQIPYFLWVTFAAYINLAVYLINR